MRLQLVSLLAWFVSVGCQSRAIHTSFGRNRAPARRLGGCWLAVRDYRLLRNMSIDSQVTEASRGRWEQHEAHHLLDGKRDKALLDGFNHMGGLPHTRLVN